MICEKCHKNLATLRYAEVINGKVSDLMICPDCYAEIQHGSPAGFEIAGAAPAPKRVAAKRRTADAAVPKDACRVCGMELREALEARTAGCRACYEHLGDRLDAVLRDIHGASRHRGKTPRTDNKRKVLRGELQTKRVLLRSALKAEDYEEAAVLRDAIRRLEMSLAAPVGSEN